MQAQKETLIVQITEAFDRVPPPANNFGIYSAEAADDYRDPTDAERALDRVRNWQEVTIKQMADCPAALSHLKPDGLHFYLPAFMILSLRHEDDPAYNGYAFMDSPEYTLYPSGKGLAEYTEERHSRFDEQQIEAIITYLEYRNSRFSNAETSCAIEYWNERMVR